MLLVADGVGVEYGDRRVLTSASVRAAAGRVTALVGRNGVGKSSLLRVATGQQRPMYGTVHFGGRPYRRPSLPAFARAGLFFLPDRELLEPSIPLGKQLRSIARRFRGPPPETVAGQLGIAARLDATPASLSGGELRRAEIAVALVRRPRCLVADEPFRGIDPRDTEAIAEALRWQAREGTAVLVTGHEMATLEGLAEAVVWCVAGTTHEYGSAAEAWNDAQLQRDLLGIDMER